MAYGMKRYLRLACIQNNAGSDWKKNLIRVNDLVKKALRYKVELIAFPETFCARESHDQSSSMAHEVTPRIIWHFCDLAKKNQVAFLLGSVTETSPQKTRFYNTSILISETGRIAARYRKIHLFDIKLKGRVVNRESKWIFPGRRIETGRVWGMRMGLTVCYDLRFPELFRRLVGQGARLVFVPANFTETTGKDHWEVLLRARAIENQIFVVAPGQVGIHPVSKIPSFGTSLVIDPWGRVLARGSQKREEILIAQLDFSFQDRLRREFPVLRHRRLIG